MDGNILGESLTGRLDNLSSYETYFSEGDTGEIRLYLQRPLYQEEIVELGQKISSEGVVLTAPINQDSRILVIKFQKAIAPLLIIGGAIAAVVGSVLGWQIFKTTQKGVPLWVWGVGALALLYLFTRTKTGQTGIQISKAYFTKKALG